MSLKNISAKRNSISNDEMKKKLMKTNDPVDPIIADESIAESVNATASDSAKEMGKTNKKENCGRKKVMKRKDAAFAVYLTAEEAEEMKQYCEKEDRSTSFFIRRAIQNELARIKKD